MGTKQYYSKCLLATSKNVLKVKEKDLANSTPDTEWDLHKLLNHMVSELAWIPDMLSGMTVVEVGNKYDGDLLGKSATKSWRVYCSKANKAVDAVDLNSTVYLSYKQCSASEYIQEVAGDLLIHSWDVAKSINASDNLPRDLVEQLYEILEPQVSKFQGMGIYAKPIKVDKNSDLQTKLLALLGRNRDWPNK